MLMRDLTANHPPLAQDEDAILTLDGLSVRYGSGETSLRALDRVSLTLPRGGALGVVGESGSGKSTLAMTLMGLLAGSARVDGGHAVFEGEDLYALPPTGWAQMRGRRIGLVFQDPFTSLNPAKTIARQLTEPLILHRGLDEAGARAEARRLLDEVGIPDPEAMLAAYPHALSGGMKQRALIAAALAGEPDLLILDEPTTALDVTIEAQILDLLETLRAERQLSMIFISHNLGVIARVVDDVCVLYAGQVVETGPKASIFDDPRHPYTKGLLASMPRLDTPRARLETIPGRLPDLTAPPHGCLFQSRCPFAEARCGEPQAMVALGEDRESRCWKAPDLAATPWHSLQDHTAEAPARRAADDPSTPPALRAEEVTRSFRRSGAGSLRIDRSGGIPVPRYVRPAFKAVDNVSLTVKAGETVGLVGESGCGKSTLARCLIRLIEPDGGAIELDGRNILLPQTSRRREIAKTAQFVFQNPDSSLNPRKTVRQILARPLQLLGEEREGTIDQRVERLLDMVRLSRAYMDRYPHEMSGGEKQRIGIARVLAAEPKFVICDEAVSALDVSVQASILNLLADLRDELGLAYLFISHDLSVVRHIADRVAVMYRGGVVEVGPAASLGSPGHHPYTEALLSAVPTLDGRASERVRLAGTVSAPGGDIKGCRFADRCPRKIGPVCDTATPPWRETADGTRLACHLSMEELAAPLV
ncbi:peptide ABC transporter ATP-binding protein [Acuticoccus sediminis]|uniref:Peptide ABC transporter ATP-binding protein n=2 Tax=Acuticoccus sediminis TaxID=2184697 RepID=A0A8B2NVH2_9HYPH|nr:peptide ABC transporter ATP-binding protein [Acuticoccus sediminis]